MSINHKVIAITLILITFATLATIIYVQSKRIDNANKTIGQKDIELANLHTDMQKYENMCKLLQEQTEKKEIAVSQFIETSQKAQTEHAKRIETIETSEDACDWLDMPVPDSIRMLFQSDCSTGTGHIETTVGTHDALRSAQNTERPDKP